MLGTFSGLRLLFRVTRHINVINIQKKTFFLKRVDKIVITKVSFLQITRHKKTKINRNFSARSFFLNLRISLLLIKSL